MATVNITGRVVNASEVAVEGAEVIVTPSPASPGAAQTTGSSGVSTSPVFATTDSSGDFTIAVITGVQYALEIPAIGFKRTFRGPTGNTTFNLLGLTPFLEDLKIWTNESDAEVYTQIVVKVDPIATVLERFDSVVIEVASDGLGGSFAELDTLDLEPGITFYVGTDSDSGDEYAYRAHYLHTASGDVSQDSPEQLAHASKTSNLLLPVEELKENYLFGVDLTDDQGVPYPRRLFEHYIRAAIGWLSKELDVPLIAADFTETHDHYAQDYGRWGYFQLDRYPVVSVDAVTFQYPSMDAGVTMDLSWVVVCDEGRTGVIQIVPGQGNLADVLLIPGALMPLWSGATGRVPGVWTIQYRAGFEPTTFPDELKHLVAMAAAIGALNIAGDLVAGAGLASFSVSVPGLSQSIGTTSSATNSGYGARIIEYQKEIKEQLPLMRRAYGKGSQLTVV